jgi:phospholipid/cholesterol/gamma-HCH transport system ATP-binding protein
MDMNTSANTKAPAIEFRNVSLSFDGRLVLDDISFRLGQGEMIVLTGVSGSGKSVLLRLAMGLTRPDSGQIFIEGQEIETLDESQLIDIRGRTMGMVFQEDSLFTGLTVYENAAYRLEEQGWSDEQIERAVSEVLQFVGLEGEEEKFPEELSGGMKRRLEIARGMIGWPRIMLFDEPTMSLDPLAANKVLDLIIRARDVNHISSLYVSKKIYEISYLAQYRANTTKVGEVTIEEAQGASLPKLRVIVLDAGKIIFEGTAEDFTKSEIPAMKELLTLDRHDHSNDPNFTDPWDKRRHPAERIL